MENNTDIFREEEFPFPILERFGLTRDMIEDLPQSTIDKLKKGHPTPLLPIIVKTDEGVTLKSYSRISFVHVDKDKVDVLFCPKVERANLSRFNTEQQRKLYAGDIIVTEDKEPDGTAKLTYYQIDSDTGQLVSAPVAVIERNINLLSDILRLTPAERTCLKNGQPLTLTEGKEQFTYGVDLSTRQCLAAVQGDETDFRNRDKRDWERYNFGLSGCWTIDDNGNPDYIHEEQYTDEIWEEMRRRSTRAMSR